VVLIRYSPVSLGNVGDTGPFADDTVARSEEHLVIQAVRFMDLIPYRGVQKRSGKTRWGCYTANGKFSRMYAA